MRLCWLKSPDKMDEREGSLTGGCITPHTRNSDSNAAPATGETAQQQTTSDQNVNAGGLNVGDGTTAGNANASDIASD